MTKKTSVFQVSGSILILVGLLMVVAVQAFAAPTETVVNQTEPTDPEPVGPIDDKDESDPIRIAPDHNADEMAPEAYFRATKAEGIATALGFILAVFLTSLE